MFCIRDHTAEIEREIVKPVVRSGTIGRYWAQPTALVLFPYETDSGHAKLISQGVLRDRFPKAWKYLLANRRLLEEGMPSPPKFTSYLPLCATLPADRSVYQQMLDDE